jgi:hypothetical protein
LWWWEVKVVGWRWFCEEIELCVSGCWILEDKGDNVGLAMVKEKCYYAEKRERCGGDGGLW